MSIDILISVITNVINVMPEEIILNICSFLTHDNNTICRDIQNIKRTIGNLSLVSKEFVFLKDMTYIMAFNHIEGIWYLKMKQKECDIALIRENKKTIQCYKILEIQDICIKYIINTGHEESVYYNNNSFSNREYFEQTCLLIDEYLKQDGELYEYILGKSDKHMIIRHHFNLPIKY